MSDQYAPQTPPVHRPGMDPDRNLRTDPPGPPIQQVQVSSGFGTGAMVAGVFVVVGLLAFAFYSPGDAPAPATTPASEINIDNSAPAAPAVTPDAPAATVVEPAAPEAVAPDAVAPDAVAPDAVAPDATAPAAPAAPAPQP
ncbi:MAG: hypothetical protein V4712_02590 [Pseudomonadota bacterium]